MSSSSYAIEIKALLSSCNVLTFEKIITPINKPDFDFMDLLNNIVDEYNRAQTNGWYITTDRLSDWYEMGDNSFMIILTTRDADAEELFDNEWIDYIKTIEKPINPWNVEYEFEITSQDEWVTEKKGKLLKYREQQ